MQIKGTHNNIYGDPEIGEGTTIGSFVEIGPDVIIGRDCSIQSFVFIPRGVIIGNNVFIGPRVTFLNDKHPPSGGEHWKPIIVEEGVSIGGAATILPGVILRKGTKVGAGAVVTKSTEANSLVVGVPARPV